MSPLAWTGLAAVVFAAAAVYDWATARYVAAAAAGRPTAAAAWSSLTSLVGLVGLVGVLRVSPWLAIPEVAGVYVGTLLGVRQGRP